MKPREYSWRFAKGVSNGLVRAARQRELREELFRLGPATVYAGCLDYAIRCGSSKATGYAAHLFKEIFGEWPRPQDRRVEPKALPNFLIEEWAASRQRKSKRPRLPLFEVQP